MFLDVATKPWDYGNHALWLSGQAILPIVTTPTYNLAPHEGQDVVGAYDHHPDRFLERLHSAELPPPHSDVYCAGFELGSWRCVQFAAHLISWLPEYALPEEELQIHHGNAYVKFNQAAVRVYTSPKYAKRGEAGEIALHAICRDFFGTVPISSRVFYKSASNDVVKSFDLVHARFPEGSQPQIWLGESKLYEKSDAAIADAIASVTKHLDARFLTEQKLLLGHQIPKSTPHYAEVKKLFESQTSIDNLLSSATFVVGICGQPRVEGGKAGQPDVCKRGEGRAGASSGKIAEMRTRHEGAGPPHLCPIG